MRRQFEVTWHEQGWPQDAHKTNVDMWARDDGSMVATEIAKAENVEDFEHFREDTTIIITSPEDIAGTYHIAVGTVLSFIYSAYASND